MRLIDGRAIAATVAEEVSAKAERLRAVGTTPTLAAVVPTDDEASSWYVQSLQHAAACVGIECVVDTFRDAGPDGLPKRLDALSADPAVHGIICQTPLPSGLTPQAVAERIDPAKDVDGVNPMSVGRLAAGMAAYPPATAAAVLQVLRHKHIAMAGARAVVVGRSAVGKPVAHLLLAEHATVTVCHSKTVEPSAVCAEADILVVAVGHPKMIDAAYIKPGATVVIVDVGTDPTDNSDLVGDDANAIADVSVDGAIVPVRAGIGSVTTMMLMRHTAHAADLLASSVLHRLRTLRPTGRKHSWPVGPTSLQSDCRAPRSRLG